METGTRMLKLSVVVPVYNVEKYLETCLYSLVNQTISEYEIIIVNDGSTDSSQKIIDCFKEEYPDLIRTFTKPNEGLSMTRNFGIQYASGEYITFLDSDDYVELDLYERMYNQAVDQDADLVVADIEYFWEANAKEEHYMKGAVSNSKTVSAKDMFLAPLFSWNKLYRRSLFLELQCEYPPGLWYEDIPVTLRFLAYCKSIAYCQMVGYHYLQRNTSILGSINSPKMYDIFTIFQIVVEDFEKRNLLQEYSSELEYLFVEHFLLYGAFRFFRSFEYEKLMKRSFREMRVFFPRWRKNKYVRQLPIKYKLFLYTNNQLTLPIWRRVLKTK